MSFANISCSLFILEGGRLTQHGLCFIDRFFKKFPNTHIIVVFTKVRKSLIENEEMEKTFNQEMLHYLRNVKGRWIVMPNSELFDDSESKVLIKRKVDELKNKITEIEGVDDKVELEDKTADMRNGYSFSLCLSKCEIL